MAKGATAKNAGGKPEWHVLEGLVRKLALSKPSSDPQPGSLALGDVPCGSPVEAQWFI
jgi:hypothetical protein